VKFTLAAGRLGLSIGDGEAGVAWSEVTTYGITELTKEDASCGCVITTGIRTRLARTMCCPRRSRRP
jgi:hypothetical protein